MYINVCVFKYIYICTYVYVLVAIFDPLRPVSINPMHSLDTCFSTDAHTSKVRFESSFPSASYLKIWSFGK